MSIALARAPPPDPATLAAIVDEHPEPILLLSLDGTVLLWNGAAERVTSIAATDAVGKTLDSLGFPPLPARAWVTGSPFDPTYTRPDGSTVRLRLRTLPVRNAEREFVGVAVLAVDLSAFEAELDEAKALHARLAELERLKKLETFRAAFVNETAHHLLTPLTPLWLSLAVLRAEVNAGADGRLRRHLDIAERNVARLNDHVQDMLALAADETSFGTPSDDLDLSDVLHRVLDAKAERIAREGVKLSRRIAPGLLVRGHRHHLEQALVILLTRACESTPSGGTVSVTAAARRGSVEVGVHDGGSTLAPNPSSARSLGLRVVHEIADLHRGTVYARRDAHGTHVTLALPLLSDKRAATPPQST